MLSCPLILVGGAALRRGPEDSEPSGGWPPVSMVVPVGDLTPSTRPAMESLLSQDYPDLEVIFSAQEEDPAVRGLAAGLIEGRANAKLMLSGRAETCSQKNHNLLAGVKGIPSTSLG